MDRLQWVFSLLCSLQIIALVDETLHIPDDRWLFLKASVDGATELSSVMESYCNASSQRINLSKSFVYFTKGCPNNLKKNIPKLAFWTAILKVRPLLVSASFYKIVNGSSSIWSSPWLSQWQNIYDNLIVQNQDFIYPARVNQLWMPRRKEWKCSLVDSLFL